MAELFNARNMATIFKKNEAYNALLYLLGKFKDNTCDIHKLCKLLYFADQLSLSRYGRSITGDDYIAMRYGPVPSNVYDMFKALNGASFFFPKESLAEAGSLFLYINKSLIKAKAACDEDYLSETDTECLDEVFDKYAGLNFAQLTDRSHGFAWENTGLNSCMTVEDMVMECGDTEEYAQYVADGVRLKKLMAHG